MLVYVDLTTSNWSNTQLKNNIWFLCIGNDVEWHSKYIHMKTGGKNNFGQLTGRLPIMTYINVLF